MSLAAPLINVDKWADATVTAREGYGDARSERLGSWSHHTTKEASWMNRGSSWRWGSRSSRGRRWWLPGSALRPAMAARLQVTPLDSLVLLGNGDHSPERATMYVVTGGCADSSFETEAFTVWPTPSPVISALSTSWVWPSPFWYLYLSCFALSAQSYFLNSPTSKYHPQNTPGKFLRTHLHLAACFLGNLTQQTYFKKYLWWNIV